jgi:hypothetical protein
MTNKSKEYQQGVDAYTAGKELDTNPWDDSREGASRQAHKDWNLGWLDTHNATPRIIVDINTRQGSLTVTKKDDRYDVVVAGVVRHPNCNADSAIGAMAHYLHGAEYKLMKDAKQFSQNVALRNWIAQEIRLAMQQDDAAKPGSNGGIYRAAVAEIRTGRILAKLDGHPVGEMTFATKESIESATRQLLSQKD